MTRIPSLRTAKSILAIGVVAALAACGDAPSPIAAVAPDAELQALIDAPAAAAVARPIAAIRASVSGNPADTTVVTFQVGPQGGNFAVGPHWINFPANAVCDPAQSSYGPTEWNKSCVIASAPVTVTAKAWADSAGSPKVVFSEHLRFDPTKQVILHMVFDYKEGDAQPDILWARDSSATAVNEGDVDRAMVTRGGAYWFVFRRVKHFSGYTLSTGFLNVRVGGGVEVDLGLGNRNGAIPTVGPLNSGHVVATGAIK